MATLTLQAPSLTGATPSYAAAAAGGDEFSTDRGQVYLVFKTAGTASTVTINGENPCDQGFDHDTVVVLPATGERWIGPFPTGRFGAVAEITYTSVTGLTVAAVKYA